MKSYSQAVNILKRGKIISCSSKFLELISRECLN